MSKRIHCHNCLKHVGTIENGSKLAKGLHYTCTNCVQKKSIFADELENIVLSRQSKAMNTLKRKMMYDYE